MTLEEQAVVLYRLAELERIQRHDHEPRIREVEQTLNKLVAKVAAYAALGSIAGGAVVTAVVNLFIR